jgi:gamma-glutamylaminecyclotransferase
MVAPMMLNEPGRGHRVHGELYDVDDARLAVIDLLESVPKPGNQRLVIDVETMDGEAAGRAFVYMKSRSLATPVHSGCSHSYRDHRFVPPDQRDNRSTWS